MATLHLDRLPTRDQGRDGDRAHVMDRGVMRLCYKHKGEWYCSFPDVRQVKKDFTEMGRIQWVAPRGIFVPTLARSLGIMEMELLRIYDLILLGVTTADPNYIQTMRIVRNTDSYVRAMGVIESEILYNKDMVLAGVAMSLTEQAAKLIISRTVTVPVHGMGILSMEKMLSLEYVLLSAIRTSLSYQAKIIVKRTSDSYVRTSGIINIEKLSPVEFILLSVARGYLSKTAIMKVLRTVSLSVRTTGMANIERLIPSDIILLSAIRNTNAFTQSLKYGTGISSTARSLGIMEIEKIEKLLRGGYYDWGVGNYANMEIHENQTRWIQIHDASNTPLGNRYQVDFGEIQSGEHVESQNTITIGPLTYTPYINSFGLYSAETGGTYYMNLNVVLSYPTNADGRLTLQENQYIQINPGQIVVAAI